ncbi:glycosyl transferases group 1 family protein [Streptococcus intermedius BA1]|uniref:glycosyltransferase family 4 protein n=1 Tax=Streptococcus intermedius TaxID=1338 RepID=UPI00029C1410|nr:glycosyltransferase family 4 protein [Streptococcus intermedius]EKU16216.1 glycosyl transferases group 1 family protein [Streptococcus intermedius BA1]
MKKALMLSSVSSMIASFNKNNISILQSLGYEVHVITNFNYLNNISQEKANDIMAEFENNLMVRVHNVSISRSPFSLSNFKAYKQISRIMQKENFNLVHCHSPVGGILGRMAANQNKVENIIYTAHGFHFFKGASIKNWLTFYPIEKFFSYFTDDLITINSEDFQLAKKSFHAKRLHYVNGVGIDLKKFDADKKKVNSNKKQTKLKLISIGELNKNKNHRLVIEAIHQSKFKDCFSYDICGEGTLKEELTQLIKQYGLENQVRLLGYRDDVHRLLAESDIFVFPSFREGLPVSVMEAMATGLPVLASDIRGNHDLVVHEKGGFLFESGDVEDLVHYLEECFLHQENMIAFGDYNLQKIQEYSSDYVDSQMREIYLNRM